MIPRAPACSLLSSELSFPKATFPVVLRGEPIDDRRDHPTRTTPGRPDIDHRGVILLRKLVELSPVEFLDRHGCTQPFYRSFLLKCSRTSASLTSLRGPKFHCLGQALSRSQPVGSILSSMRTDPSSDAEASSPTLLGASVPTAPRATRSPTVMSPAAQKAIRQRMLLFRSAALEPDLRTDGRAFGGDQRVSPRPAR